MRERVACDSCGAHRDRALPFTERCFVCGSGRYTAVPPNEADRAYDAELSAAVVHVIRRRESA